MEPTLIDVPEAKNGAAAVQRSVCNTCVLYGFLYGLAFLGFQ
jgi:hypothetical protein